MIYRDFKGIKLSALGFGMMRLPLNADNTIDEDTTGKMVDLAMENGVNYFDTAWPYHAGYSEIVAGKLLSKYPRDSYYLATKFPGHQINDSYDPAEVFEKQLRKCGVDYFDFYLLHNVYEKSFDVYNDPKWGIIDYFVEQKKLGRIRHLGFSSHGRPDNLKAFLDLYGDKMEFCQIQMNYVDFTLQEALKKYEMLTERGIAVWVMEPLRGGRLAKLSDKDMALLEEKRPGKSPAAWAFDRLKSFENIKVILSGMSDIDQMKENIDIFSDDTPLTEEESALLESIGEGMKNSIPCTACGYCKDSCPMELDIPMLLHTYNDVRFGLEGGLTASMQMEALPEDKLPTACIGCGACEAVCPQGIEIPTELASFSEDLEKLPKWSKICVIRNEEAEKIKI